MKKLKLYLAISLNGKIARPNGDVDWLEAIPNPDSSDYGYYAFYNSIDTTVQGNNTYKMVLSFGVDFPYSDKTNYVLTRDGSLTNDEHVTYISDDAVNFVRALKKQDGLDIWLVGGAQLNTLFLNAGLVDEVTIHVMPIIIADGIDLFAGQPIENQLTLIESKSYPSGVVELRYRPHAG